MSWWLPLLGCVTGLIAEAQLLRRIGATVFVGPKAAEQAVAAGARALLSFGLAGGLDPALAPGAVVRPSHVQWRGRVFAADPGLTAALGGPTCDALFAGEAVAVTGAEKRALRDGTGASAIDLESGFAAETGLPFAVLRAVCDGAGKDLPPAALVALDTAGAIGIMRLAGSVIGQPHQIPGLLGLAADAWRARRALVREMEGVLARGALKPWL